MRRQDEPAYYRDPSSGTPLEHLDRLLTALTQASNALDDLWDAEGCDKISSTNRGAVQGIQMDLDSALRYAQQWRDRMEGRG